MMFPYAGSNWDASGHCDYLYQQNPETLTYKTTSGFKWEWVGVAYLWILE